MKITKVLDLRGKECPRVILLIRQEMETMDENDIVKVISSDGGSVNEMKCYAAYMKVKILEKAINKSKSEYIYIIQK